MPKRTITLPDGGPTLEADVTKIGLLGLHPALGDAKGFILTHLPSGAVVLRTSLKREAIKARKVLEELDWRDLDGVHSALKSLRASF